MSPFRLFLLLLEGPLRFFLVNTLLAFTILASTMRLSPREGYPWPGFISYHPPGIALLFLGTVLAVAFVQLKILAPINAWGRLLSFLLTVFACASTLFALTPEGALLECFSLICVAILILTAFNSSSRSQFLARLVFVLFLLILLKFVFLSVGSTLLEKLGVTWILGLGTAEDTNPSVESEYLLFFALLSFTAALALQWPPQGREYEEDGMLWLFGQGEDDSLIAIEEREVLRIAESSSASSSESTPESSPESSARTTAGSAAASEAGASTESDTEPREE